MRTAAITAFVLSTLAAATGCSATARSVQPIVAGRECSAQGAYVVSSPTIQHGFGPSVAETRVTTVDPARLEGRGVVPDRSGGVPVRTAADTASRGGPTCF
jgi:hypothetical protein